jgi:hypothetical protein
LNYGWSFFKTPGQVASSAGRITLQYLPGVKASPQLTATAPSAQCDHFELRHSADGDRLYAKANQSLKRKETLLFSNLDNVKQLICRNDTALLIFNGIILRSTDGGATWRSFHIAPFGGQVDAFTVRAFPLSYGQYWFDNNNFFTGYLSYGANNLDFTQEGIFATFFDLDSTSSTYAHLYQEWQQQMRAGFSPLAAPPLNKQYAQPIRPKK